MVDLGAQSLFTASTSDGSDTDYVWQSSDPTTATVDANGMVTALKTGSVEIMATGNVSGLTGTVQVEISADNVPFFEEWAGSGHNDVTAEAFRHWDEDGEIPTRCAKCHSTHGFRDFLGDDGSTEGVVDQAAALGTTVECAACHNAKSLELTMVTFPSGVTVPNGLADEPLGREAVCMSCHQGRESKDDVDAAIAAAAPADDDAVLPDQGFLNIHYFPAAATRYGGIVRGGYMYDSEHYDVLFRHAPGLEKCQDCHDPHSLQIKLNVCATCHTNVVTMEDLKDIRMESSKTRDYDGDGNLVEGLYFEIDTLRMKLLTAIQEYANEVLSMPIIYDSHSYPYWFNDNGQGANFGNRYTTYSSRLLKATFNYQYATKDPGGFAHNGKFIIQLLHDSIADLNAAITNKVDMTAAVRNDKGHFDGTAEAFRHWDEDGFVRGSCSRCHSASEGFDEYLKYGTNIENPIANGFDCAVCHTTFGPTFETRQIFQVEFPSGKTTPQLDASSSQVEIQSNICITCHQGRVSKKDIDDRIASGASLSFMNVHYLAAAATLFGTDAMVGYEYDGKTYESKFLHIGAATNSHHCTYCHSPANTTHTFQPQDNIVFCRQCHTDQAGGQLLDVKDIRLNRDPDYDGDGLYPGSPMGTERLKGELDTMAEALWAEIQDYAENTLGDAIVYDDHAYPYFHSAAAVAAAGGNASFGTRYRAWDPALLKAAHNYQHSQKEFGAWAHNFYYIIQLVYDSIEDMGGDVSAYTRP